MRLLVIAIAAFGLVSCGAQSSYKMDTNPTSAIIGGTLVAEGESPSENIVGIYDEVNKYICTGSLIGDGIVLTAAHCVFGTKANNLKIIFAPDIMAVLGTSENDIRQQLMRQAIEFIYHEKYNEDDQEENQFDWSDIAVIKFKGSTPAGFKPATILANAKDIKVGMTATMAGYGVAKVSTFPVEARKVKDLKQAIADGTVFCDDDNENCLEVTMDGDGELRKTTATIAYVIRSEIRLDESKGHATCMGDSGGPIYLVQNGQHLLIGLTSRGSSICDKVGIYTNVPYYKDWIDFTVKKLR